MMYHNFNFEATLASSLRAQWALDDVLRADQDLDFSRNFMPESLARTAAIETLNPFEQRILNQISAHQYLCIFGVVEEFILPFLLDHSLDCVRGDDWRIRAFLNFASEEAKHIHLFKRFHKAFVRGFPVECQVIGPSEAIGAEVLRHDPLAVGLLILMIEWMTQEHFLGSIRDNGGLDQLFKSLMKHQLDGRSSARQARHADRRRARSRPERRTDRQGDRRILRNWRFSRRRPQNSGRLQPRRARKSDGRKVENRDEIIDQQHQAARWTYIGSGMVHERFKATLNSLSPRAAERIAEAAPVFA